MVRWCSRSQRNHLPPRTPSVERCGACFFHRLSQVTCKVRPKSLPQLMAQLVEQVR